MEVLLYDIWYEISEKIDDGETWKNFIFTCKDFSSFNTKEKVLKFSNHLWTLFIKNPGENWNYKELSKNPNTTWYIIKKFSWFKWDWDCISDNPSLPMEEVLKCPADPQWNWEFLSKNRSLNLEIVLKYRFKKWDFRELVKNESVVKSINDFINNRDRIPWNNYDEALSNNDNITIDDVIKYNTFHWNWSYVSKKYITIDHVLNNSHLPWDWFELSRNKNIVTSINVIQIYSYLPWNLRGISINPVISYNDMINNINDFNWNSSDIILNPSIETSYIEKILNRPTLPSILYYISLHLSFTLDLFKKYKLFKPWDMANISCNPNIIQTWYDVIENPDIKWDYDYISRNPFKKMGKIPLPKILRNLI